MDPIFGNLFLAVEYPGILLKYPIAIENKALGRCMVSYKNMAISFHSCSLSSICLTSIHNSIFLST